MEHIKQKQNVLSIVFPVLILMGIALSMIVIIYGVESVAPGVHDTFHDFRHVIGMPCH